MIQDIIIPNLGLTMDEAAIAKWVKDEGNSVEKGEVVLVIETDKITYEVESPQSGFLHIIGEIGGKYPVTSVVGWIAETKEEYDLRIQEEKPVVKVKKETEKKRDTVRPLRKEADAGSSPEERIRISPRARRLAQEKDIIVTNIEGTGPGGRIMEEDVLRASEGMKKKKISVVTSAETTNRLERISPLAKKMAEANGIDITDIKGTGPGGRIVKTDVLKAIEEKTKLEGMSQEVAPSALKQVREVVPIRGARKIIFEHMHRSLKETAQLTLTMEVNAAQLIRFRGVLVENLKKNGPLVSYNTILVSILAHVLDEHPQFNSSVLGNEIWVWKSVNIGVAMDAKGTLVVPVIRDVNSKELNEIQRDLDTLIDKVRSEKLLPDDLQGGTFTLTNLGFLDIEAFTPILNMPETGILGVGRIVEKPVVESGEIKVGCRMMLSLTFDHRVIDGAEGARFLKRIKAYVEEPYMLVASRSH